MRRSKLKQQFIPLRQTAKKSSTGACPAQALQPNLRFRKRCTPPLCRTPVSPRHPSLSDEKRTPVWCTAWGGTLSEVRSTRALRCWRCVGRSWRAPRAGLRKSTERSTRNAWLQRHGVGGAVVCAPQCTAGRVCKHTASLAGPGGKPTPQTQPGTTSAAARSRLFPVSPPPPLLTPPRMCAPTVPLDCATMMSLRTLRRGHAMASRTGLGLRARHAGLVPGNKDNFYRLFAQMAQVNPS